MRALWSAHVIKAQVFHYCETVTFVIWSLIFNYVAEWADYTLFVCSLLLFFDFGEKHCVVHFGESKKWIPLL